MIISTYAALDPSIRQPFFSRDHGWLFPGT
jgi:hypothetical protein